MNTKNNLESKLWESANVLRGAMASDEYKNYLLGLIFYKFLSEKQEKFADEALSDDGFNYDDIADKNEFLQEIKKASQEELGYIIHPHELFGYLDKKGNIEKN